MTKTPVLERLSAQLAALTAITFSDTNVTESKKSMFEAVRKSSTGFGNLSDHVQTQFDAAKALVDEGSNRLAAKNFTEKSEYASACTSFRDQAVTVIEALKEAVEALPDDIGLDESGEPTGTRSTFILHAKSLDDPNKVTEMRTGEISKAFIESETFKTLEASAGMSAALKKFFHDELRITWDESDKAATIFYKIYRQIRPSVTRALAKRNAPPAPVEA